MISQRFGRWLVISFSHKAKNGVTFWLCRCDCGTEKVVERSSLVRGDSHSCGCLRAEQKIKQQFIHGHAKTGKRPPSPTYNTWAGMIGRCGKYSLYVVVDVCEDWKIFENFLRDMGERPDGRTLDRIDGDKGYYKNNCRWATKTEQSQNKRKVKITSSKYKGVSLLDAGNWIANIQANGKKYKLGTYATEKEAALVYNDAAKKLHGIFAVLNIIQD